MKVTARYALYMCAAHCQGGHSDAGRVAADVLGIPFPITMSALVEQARSEGFDPDELWPWLKQLHTRQDAVSYRINIYGKDEWLAAVLSTPFKPCEEVMSPGLEYDLTSEQLAKIGIRLDQGSATVEYVIDEKGTG